MIYLTRYDTGKYKIRMTQNFIDKEKVLSIINDMIQDKYDFNDYSNKIGIEFNNHVYYVTEGHHRMQAALEIWKEFKNYQFVEQLIKNALIYPIKYSPQNYRFTF